MKKLLLAAVALSTLSLNASAVTRMTLHEEFTGENCGPCAGTNPDFWALCDMTGNTSKLIHISYMVPIPSAGFYCDRTAAIHTSRMSYYSVAFAPYGRYDGHEPDPGASDPGHPAYFTQADIDAEAAISCPFTITAVSAWDATYTNISTTVTVTCAAGAPWAGSGAVPSVKLRAALVKTDDFASSPGTNGETHFENVVQAMYPDVNGTTIPTSWTAGETNTYTITGAAPSWLDKSQSPYMVVWIQDENDKSIQQAAKGNVLTAPPVDVAATTAVGPTGLSCATGTYSAAHTVTIKNAGTTPLTSATIYYSADGGPWASTPWSGTLASGATATVSIPATSVTIGMSDYHVIIDSVGMPNGTADYNNGNSEAGAVFFIQNSTGVALPYGTSFESDDTSIYFVNGTGTAGIYSDALHPAGHTSISTFAMELGFMPDATVTTIVLPENFSITAPATTALSYWVAYSQMASTNTDLLEVIYSTNCGGTWNTLSSATPTSSLPTSSTDFEVPDAPSDYKKYFVNLSAVPAGTTTLGFRVTRHGGNSMWIDDINIKSTVAVNNVNNVTADVTIYPNPANDEANLSFNLNGSSDVSVFVIDGLGRVIKTVANEKMEAGLHTVNINTTDLAAGLYNVVVNTNGGTHTEKLSIAK